MLDGIATRFVLRPSSFFAIFKAGYPTARIPSLLAVVCCWSLSTESRDNGV